MDARHTPGDRTDGAERFVRAFESAWKHRSSDAFRDLWHPNGVLLHPTLSGPLPGSRLAALNAHNLALLPDLTWSLLCWASSGDTVFLEWECKATVGGRPLQWRGVDKVTLVGDKIAEEVVYCDTLPLRAALDPTVDRGALVDVETLPADAATSYDAKK